MDTPQINKLNKKILILGAGGQGRVVAETAEAVGYTVAFLDDHNPDAIGTIGQIDRFRTSFDYFFVAIGNNELRRSLIERLQELQCAIPVLIHPSAFVSPSATVGIGTIVTAYAAVNTGATIGCGCIISLGALIDHDVVIEDYVHINTGVICKSGCHVNQLMKIESGQVVHNTWGSP